MIVSEIIKAVATELNALAERLGERHSVAAEYEELTAKHLQMVDEGLKHSPNSAPLWILRGDLIQMGGADPRYPLEDALASYRKALAHDPSGPEAYESIGFFLDAIENNPAEAEAYFRKAIALGGGKTARDGLAEVLNQLGRTEN